MPNGGPSPPANLLVDLNEAFPMDNAPGDEASTVNSYLLSAVNAPGGGSAMGGPARVFTGTQYLIDDVGLDVDICGRNIDYSKAIAFKPSALGGVQVIYGCCRDDGTPFWIFHTNGNDLRVAWGNGHNTAVFHDFPGVLVNGGEYTISFSVNFATQIARMCFNGSTFVNKNIAGIYPMNLTLGGFVTAGAYVVSGSPMGHFKGSIAAPTGWTRQLLDAEQTQWANGGSPWRL